MKLLQLLSLILLSPLLGFTQSQSKDSLVEIDSLEKQLALSKMDTHRVLILSELSLRLSRSNQETAMKYAQEGLSLARILKFRKGEADCLRRSGIILFQQGRYPEALDIYQRALSISESINYSFGIATGFGHIGNIYKEQGDYKKARFYYFRHYNIGKAVNNEFEQANALKNIGESHLLENNLDSALIFYNQAYKIFNNRWDFVLAALWKDLGKLQSKKGNEAQAMVFFRKSIPVATAGNDFIVLNEAYLGIADLHRKAGQPDSCIFYARQALTAGQKNNYAKGILAASELLSQVYETIDEREAFKYQKIATAVKDSLFNMEKANQVQNLLFVEQQRQQTLEAARIAYKNQLKLYALLSALGIFLLLAIILYRKNRNKQKANNILQSQKQEIHQQRTNAEKALEELKATQVQLIQSEKMASLGELTAGIAHEIQNPLNFVNNFSEVNTELIAEMKEEIDKGNMEEARTIAENIEENEQKISHHGKRADAIVKGMLQHSRSSSGVKEPTDINALADEYLRLAYHGLRAKDKSFNATLKTDYDKRIGKINILPQDIGRVILNLITNAFFVVTEKKKQIGEALLPDTQEYEPAVTVSTERLKDKVLIKVRDNGLGIPETLIDKIFQPFFTTKPTGQGTGLGLSLSYDIIKAHGGELKVETKEGEFAEFIIHLPVINN